MWLGHPSCPANSEVRATRLGRRLRMWRPTGRRIEEATVSPIDTASLKVVPPGGGRAGRLTPELGVVFKLWGDDTGGRLSVVEHPFDVGAVALPHLHTHEDEHSIVLEGEIGFRSGERQTVLGPGGYIVKPRGEVHAMWNASDVPARMIEVISPAGFEYFFRDLVDITDAGEPSMEQLTRLAEAYDLEFAQPSWFGEIVDQYGLRVPFGA